MILVIKAIVCVAVVFAVSAWAFWIDQGSK